MEGVWLGLLVLFFQFLQGAETVGEEARMVNIGDEGKGLAVLLEVVEVGVVGFDE